MTRKRCACNGTTRAVRWTDVQVTLKKSADEDSVRETLRNLNLRHLS